MKKLSCILLVICLLTMCCCGCDISGSKPTDAPAIEENTPTESECNHTYTEATCDSARECTICGETSGAALGHSFSNATCTAAKKCQRCGTTQGNALGHQYSNGYCIRCNTKDPNFVEYGTIEGTVTYKYNNYVGNRGDTGATVILFPNMSNHNTKKYDNSRACFGFAGNYESGIKVVKCDGNGNYVFDNVPVGRYYMLIISSKTTDQGAFENKASRESWIKGNFTETLSEADIKTLTTTIGYNKIYTENVDVLANRKHTISKDFGITYI